MKLWKIVGLVLVIGAIAVIFKSCREQKFTNFPPAANGTWVAFGDSLTSGYGAAPGHDYPAILSGLIDRPILNKGVPGETTEQALQRIDGIVRLQPRVVLLCLGGNDGLRQVPADKTFANLSAIIDQLHAGGSFVVLIGVRSASVFDRYADSFEELASEKEVLLVPDILKGVLGNPRLMADYIHPNEEGYREIAERLSGFLTPLLPVL